MSSYFSSNNNKNFLTSFSTCPLSNFISGDYYCSQVKFIKFYNHIYIPLIKLNVLFFYYSLSIQFSKQFLSCAFQKRHHLYCWNIEGIHFIFIICLLCVYPLCNIKNIFYIFSFHIRTYMYILFFIVAVAITYIYNI